MYPRDETKLSDLQTHHNQNNTHSYKNFGSACRSVSQIKGCSSLTRSTSDFIFTVFPGYGERGLLAGICYDVLPSSIQWSYYSERHFIFSVKSLFFHFVRTFGQIFVWDDKKSLQFPWNWFQRQCSITIRKVNKGRGHLWRISTVYKVHQFQRGRR